MKRDLRFEATYPHPPERVWRALTDPKALAEWLMENDFEPRLGHQSRLAEGAGDLMCETALELLRDLAR